MNSNGFRVRKISVRRISIVLIIAFGQSEHKLKVHFIFNLKKTDSFIVYTSVSISKEIRYKQLCDDK